MSDHELRFAELNRFDIAIRSRGFKAVVGIDEAGRGPLAGPVVAAACLLTGNTPLYGIDDSKKLSAKRRSDLFNHLTSDPSVIYAIGIVSPEEIDQINIYQATFLAMRKAVAALPMKCDFLLVDGNVALNYENIHSEAVIGGDGRSLSIAAASILAKETRDKLMLELHEMFPHYGFDRHKGYGTAHHMKALSTHGPCPAHRRSFAPVRAAAN